MTTPRYTNRATVTVEGQIIRIIFLEHRKEIDRHHGDALVPMVEGVAELILPREMGPFLSRLIESQLALSPDPAKIMGGAGYDPHQSDGAHGGGE
jgi:hypothetical protein